MTNLVEVPLGTSRPCVRVLSAMHFDFGKRIGEPDLSWGSDDIVRCATFPWEADVLGEARMC